MEKIWTPNENQNAFIKELENYPNGVTLLDLKVAGKEFKTGTINVLVSKGLVETTDTELACDVVYNGAVIGKLTKKVKIYRLVQKD